MHPIVRSVQMYKALWKNKTAAEILCSPQPLCCSACIIAYCERFVKHFSPIRNVTQFYAYFMQIFRRSAVPTAVSLRVGSADSRYPTAPFRGAYQICRCYGADRAYCLVWLSSYSVSMRVWRTLGICGLNRPKASKMWYNIDVPTIF